MLALEWVRIADPNAWLGWLLMALVFSLWWPGFLALTRFAVLRMRLPLLLAAPIVWVGGEFLRAYILSGFPWYYLAHSQFRRLYVIQVADVTGSLGISFLIAIFNALVVDLLSLPLLRVTKSGMHLDRRQHIRLCAVTILLGSTFCYGAFRVSNASFRDGPRLALLQSNIPQKEKALGDRAKILNYFTGLVERAIAHHETPDLIVWPETAFPLEYIANDSNVDHATLERQVRSLPDEIPVRGLGREKKAYRKQFASLGRHNQSPDVGGNYVLRSPAGLARKVQLGDPRESRSLHDPLLPQDASGPGRRVHTIPRQDAVAFGFDSRIPAEGCPASVSDGNRSRFP